MCSLLRSVKDLKTLGRAERRLLVACHMSCTDTLFTLTLKDSNSLLKHGLHAEQYSLLSIKKC